MAANENMDQVIERIAAAAAAAVKCGACDIAEEVAKRAGGLSAWMVARIESRARDIAGTAW